VTCYGAAEGSGAETGPRLLSAKGTREGASGRTLGGMASVLLMLSGVGQRTGAGPDDHHALIRHGPGIPSDAPHRHDKLTRRRHLAFSTTRRRYPNSIGGSSLSRSETPSDVAMPRAARAMCSGGRSNVRVLLRRLMMSSSMSTGRSAISSGTVSQSMSTSSSERSLGSELRRSSIGISVPSVHASCWGKRTITADGVRFLRGLAGEPRIAALACSSSSRTLNVEAAGSGDGASDLLPPELALGGDALNRAEPHVDGSDFVRVEGARCPCGFIIDAAHAKRVLVSEVLRA
jgi:hypothetical protein